MLSRVVRSKNHLQHRYGMPGLLILGTSVPHLTASLIIPVSLVTAYNRQIKLTQQAEFLWVSPGERVSITCRASQSLHYTDGNHYLSWYQERPGRPSKPLFTMLQSGLMESPPVSLTVNLQQNSPSLLKTFNLRTLHFITIFKQ